MTKRPYIFSILLISASLLFSGCTKMYTLTEDERQTIALYAAKTVTKFNKDQLTGICNAKIRDGELPKPGDIPGMDDNMESVIDPELGQDVQIDATETTTTQETEQQTTTENNTQGSTSQEVSTGGASVSEAMGIDGVEFSVEKYEICDTYSATSYFALTSPAGYRYFVLSLKGKNNSDKDILIDGLSRACKYTLNLNGVYTARAQTTVLTNDLASYKGTLKSGESKDFVLVFQYKESQLSDVSTMKLSVENADGSIKATMN